MLTSLLKQRGISLITDDMELMCESLSSVLGHNSPSLCLP